MKSKTKCRSYAIPSLRDQRESDARETDARETDARVAERVAEKAERAATTATAGRAATDVTAAEAPDFPFRLKTEKGFSWHF